MTEIHRTVLDLYRAIDAEVASHGPRCDASGRCCRFQEFGHVLYLTHLEAEVLLADAPPYDQPVSQAFCPFQVNNLCTARDSRPMGCRIYFCDPTYEETGNAITEKYLARLRALAKEHDLGWHYAPLHHFLNNADCPPSRETAISTETKQTRTALPLISARLDME